MSPLSNRSRLAALSTAAGVALLTSLVAASPAYAASVTTYGDLAAVGRDACRVGGGCRNEAGEESHSGSG